MKIAKPLPEFTLNVVLGTIANLSYIALTCWFLSILSSVAVQNLSQSEVTDLRIEVFDSGGYDLRKGVPLMNAGAGEEIMLGFPTEERVPVSLRLSFKLSGNSIFAEHAIPVQWGQVLLARIEPTGIVTWSTFTRFYFPPKFFFWLWCSLFFLAFITTRLQTRWYRKRVEEILR